LKGGFADVAPLAHHMDALDIAYCLAYLSTLVICDGRDKGMSRVEILKG